ncbi:DUF4870 domain-containing protein [Lysobacter sp. Root494]|jgi:uncharacterized protein|uniref:DUF4870 domain-containing protein n=1 Tax=Lysobacter sp. Root494 TaxID=1736549 RepID=UPI0006F47361|nr:DUF4870 domain-containing protein [Lysobacter sp. Root494]KQY51968.1 hypothetical protein ASD14_04675 [Lysobacter sp. Root494]
MNQTSSDDKTLAMVTHLSGIFLGFLMPLIVWLVSKDKEEKAYLTEQSKEALNFQITVAIAFVVSWVLMFVLIGFLLMPAVALANLILCILAAVKTSDNETYRYPFTLRLIN